MKQKSTKLSFYRRAAMTLLVMMLTTATAWADDSGNFGTMSNATWSYNSTTNTLTISGTGALDDYTVDLITDNRPFAAYKSKCVNIVINEGITSIGKSNFAYMNSVASVSIPASVTSIGIEAFYRGNSNYTAITFTIASGSNLSSIGNSAFMRTKATIDLRECTGLTTIPTFAFQKCTTVTLPNTVTSVASGGFLDCTHVYVAPKSGSSLAVNGTTVSLGSNNLYEVTSLVNNGAAITFTWINPYDLSQATLTLTNAKEGNWYAYQDGSAIDIAFTVDDANGTRLTQATDYTVSIKNSSNETVTSITDEDTYTLTVTGTGTESSGYYGSTQTTFTVSGPIALTSETTVWRDGRTYYADGEVTIGSRVTVNGTVTLDLRAGSSLTVTGGIGVNAGNSLTIGGTGSLTATATTTSYAGIGGDTGCSAGIITINGGTITATGANKAAGIGGGNYKANFNVGGDCGTITINGGTVSATAGNDAAAIGLGWFDGNYDNKPTPLHLTGSVTINGGQVTATGIIGYNDHYANKLSCSITLGWTDWENDFIEASSGYKGTVGFATGKTLQYDNNGTAIIVTADNISSMGGKRLTPYAAQTHTVTFVTGDGATAVASQTLPEGYTATRPADPLRTGYRFMGWMNGSTAYDFTAAVNSDLTLTAQWEAVSAISYIDADGSTVTGFTQYIPLEQNHTTLDGGTWAVTDDVTFTDRLTVKNSATLILTDGKTLTAQRGITVTTDDNATLTIYGQQEATGTLVAHAGGNTNACIGGEDKSGRYHCGTVNIYGGHIQTSGNGNGAGIGGAMVGNGGTIRIMGGQHDISGGASYHSIGYGYASYGTYTANITLGWMRTTDYINATGAYKGTVTLASNFVLEATGAKARTSSTFSNINGQKLVPTTQALMDWIDVQEALADEQHSVVLTNDVSSESGQTTLVVPDGVTAAIDLNGHTLQHQYAAGTNDESTVIFVNNGGALALSDSSTDGDGTITGNLWGIQNRGTLTMTGITISGCTENAINNSGVATLSGMTVTGCSDCAIYNGGALSMTDCSVTNNTGGGMENYGTLTLSGKMDITGNTRELSGVTSPYNVNLVGGTVITLGGALHSDSRIGVYTAGNATITSGAKGKAVLANFTSDQTNKYVCWTTDGTEIQLNQTYVLSENNDLADLESNYAGQSVPVSFTRTFTEGVASTICLPFKMNTQTYKDYGTFYSFVGVEKGTDEWTVTMQNGLIAILAAGTPYLYLPKQTGTVTFVPHLATDEYFTVPASGGFSTVDVTSTNPDAAGWTFKGTFTGEQWAEAPQTPTYGFSAQAVAADGISRGEFVRVGAKVRIRPFRAYMQYVEPTSNARGMNRAAADGDNLPDVLTVRLIGADGNLTGIGQMDTRTGQVTFDPEAWYTMDGMRLPSKPTMKGVYINNGKQVVIK